MIKNNDDSLVFNHENSLDLYHSLTEDNAKSVKMMLDSKDILGGALYDAQNIISVAKNITNYYKKSWAEFLIAKKKTPDLILGSMEICTHPTLNQNLGFAPEILTKLATAEDKNRNERFGTYGIVLILDSIKSSADAKKVDKLLKHQDLSAFEIRKHIINNTYPKKQIEKYNDLYFDDLGIDLSNVKDKTVLFDFLNSHKRHAKKLVDTLISPNKHVDIDLNAYDGKHIIDENILSDIKKVTDKKAFIHKFKKNTSEEKVLKSLKIGEVAEIGEEMFVADKNPLYTNGKKRLYKIDLQKDKFMELFPPIKRFSTQQGDLGDCWAISVLDGMMSKPSGRAKIFRSYGQEGEDLTIYLNTNYNRGIKFKKGELLESESAISGPNGLKYIEQAYAKSRKSNYWSVVEGNIGDKKEMHTLNSGSAEEAYNGFFQKGFYKVNNIENQSSIHSQIKVGHTITELANNPDYLLNCTFKPEFNKSNCMTNTKNKLFTRHQYSIKGYDNKSGEVYLSNPHDNSVPMVLPLEEVVKNLQNLSTCQMNVITNIYI